MKVKVRYFVTKPGGRHYWQPSKAMREQGWKPRRLADERHRALAQAEALNAQHDECHLPRPAPAPLAGRLRDQGCYIIGGPEGPTKIGIAVDPKYRMRQLQTGSAEQLQLWTFYRDPEISAARIEAAFMAEHAAFRRTGEWFTFSPTEALAALMRTVTRLRAEHRSNENLDVSGPSPGNVQPRALTH